jgi:hypothetical protein
VIALGAEVTRRLQPEAVSPCNACALTRSTVRLVDHGVKTSFVCQAEDSMVLAATPSAMLLLSCGSAAFAPPRCTPMMLAGKPALYEEGMEIIARREERMAALMDRMEGRVVLTGSATRPRRSYTLEE